MIGVLAARRHGAYSFLTCARTQTFIQRYMETLEQRIQRVAQEDVAITPYDPRWPELFRQEKGHLLNCLPNELIRRIEHFGSCRAWPRGKAHCGHFGGGDGPANGPYPNCPFAGVARL